VGEVFSSSLCVSIRVSRCLEDCHATDVTVRLTEVNRHVPTEVLGESWRLALQQLWPTEGAAYDVEQRVLNALRTRESVGERVVCITASAGKRLERVPRTKPFFMKPPRVWRARQVAFRLPMAMGESVVQDADSRSSFTEILER
jgi:hypothetical protein